MPGTMPLQQLAVGVAGRSPAVKREGAPLGGGRLPALGAISAGIPAQSTSFFVASLLQQGPFHPVKQTTPGFPVFAAGKSDAGEPRAVQQAPPLPVGATTAVAPSQALRRLPPLPPERRHALQPPPVQQLCRNPLDAALAAIKRQRVATVDEARHVSSAGSHLSHCRVPLRQAPPGQAVHNNN